MRAYLTSLRMFVVGALMLGWLAASNHCIIAGPSPTQPAKDTGCPMHARHLPQPEKPNGCEDLPCCKNLKAAPCIPAKLVTKPLWTGRLVAFFTSALVDAAAAQ